MTKDEEKGFIERVLAGDESAYEPLVTENQTKVYRLALRILKNEADAEDAAQEAFLKAYTSLADFRGDSRFSVWLYRLTNNICIDMLRKNKRAVIVSLQTEDDDGEETEIAIPDERYSPERLAERAADRDAVRTALAALPEVTLNGKPNAIICSTTKGQGVGFMMERPCAWHIGGFDDDKLAEAEKDIKEYTAKKLAEV